MFLIGTLEDNIDLFIRNQKLHSFFGEIITQIGYPSGKLYSVFSESEPLYFSLYMLLSRLTNSVTGYNILLLITLLANIFFSYKFYRKFFNDKQIGLMLSFIFSLSPYFYYHSRSHLDLCQLWPLFIFLNILFFNESRYKSLYLGLIAGVSILLSNYIGYFLLIFYTLYILLSGIKKIKKTLLSYFIFVIGVSLVVIPSLTLYFNKLNTYTDTSFMPSRTLEDFTIFSSRPWHYLLPPIDNPFTGPVTKYVHHLFDKYTDNYLFNNYFKSEHSSSYLGLINIVLAIYGYKMFIRKNRTPLILVFFALVILSLPPIITIKSVNIYMPSYIMFLLFPVFRSLVRISPIALSIFLIPSGFGLLRLKNKFESTRITNLILSVVLSLCILDFYIPVRVQLTNDIPKAYAENSSNDIVYAVYPYSKTNLATFWISQTDSNIVNPRFYNDTNTGFKSEEFTNNLNTCLGLKRFQDLGGTHLVYYKNDDREYKRNSILFSTYLDLDREYIYKNSCTVIDNDLIRVTDLVDCSDTSLIVYTLPRNVIRCNQ